MANDFVSETLEDNSALAFVKFPTISIKCFDSESDSFEFAINKNDTLSDIQNVNYLKKLFKGEAASIISYIKLANEKA